MADSIRVPSWAKVNYTLDVLSKRPDGFHNLASVMQTISLADTLTIRRHPGTGITLECDMPGVPTDDTNLAWAAARAVLGAAGRSDGLHLRLEKRVPMQAGLGGGSANAAAALRGVDALLGIGMGPEGLGPLAAGLGSDVPFFLAGGTAAVRGRGESVTPLADGPVLWLVIVKPPTGVATGPAYAALDSMPGRVSARSTRHMEADLAAGDVDRIVARMTNDFEEAVFDRYPAITLLMDDMAMARLRPVHLCGSGSAVFGVAFTRDEAERAARLLRLKYADVHVCRTVGRAEALAMREGPDADS